MAQRDLFLTMPDGFALREGVLSAEDEAALTDRFAALPFTPFEFHGHLGKRRIVSFGYRYDYGVRKIRETAPLPDYLLPLQRLAGTVAGSAPDAFSQALVTEYAPGAGIGWHRDKAMFGDVVAFSFLAPCLLRFRRRNAKGWERRAQLVPPRSAYLLRGDARWEWEHSIPPQAALRYSVTFRNFVERADKPRTVR